jgi:hypothetical protein
LPAGTFTQSWQTEPQTVVYGGHVGINGNSVSPGWGPYEHLPPSEWTNGVGEDYRRCCTSVSWIGEALAARLIPGMQAAWNHPQFFAYADRWMFVPDDPNDVAAMLTDAGVDVSGDYRQGQSWDILSGGGYYEPYANFVDAMWAQYRKIPQVSSVAYHRGGPATLTVQNLNPNKTNYVQFRTNLLAGNWVTIYTNITGAWSTISTNIVGGSIVVTNVTGTNSFTFQSSAPPNNQCFYRVVQAP